MLIGAWVLGLGLLVKREYWHPRGEPLADAGERVPPGAAFYALTMGGQQIGYASRHIRFGPDATATKEKPSPDKPHP